MIFILGLTFFIMLLLMGCVGSSNKGDSSLVTITVVIMLFGLFMQVGSG